MEAYEFASGVTAEDEPWPAGVSWRAAAVDLNCFYLTALDARVFDRRGNPTLSRQGFTEILHRWADPEVPQTALGDLLVLSNGTFWAYASKAIYGDLRGHRLVGRTLGPRKARDGDLLSAKIPNIACRWWFATVRSPSGIVASFGRGVWRQRCGDDGPPGREACEMILGGGVLLHSSDLDVLALPRQEYEDRFDELNHGFWKSKSGEQLRKKPFGGAGEARLPENPLRTGHPLARWAISLQGAGRVQVVSVGEGLDAPSGMGIYEFARFVDSRFGGEAIVMFDGSKPHAFAASPDVGPLDGGPAVQWARCRPPNAGGDSNSLLAVFRRTAASILALGEDDARVPVTRRSGPPDPPTVVDIPEPSEDPADPPPDLAVHVELRTLDGSKPSSVRLLDGSGAVVHTWAGEEIDFDEKGTQRAVARWSPSAIPGSVEGLVLETRGGDGQEQARHRVLVDWRRPKGKVRIQVYGETTRQVLEGVELEAAAVEGTARDQATSDERGDAWLELEVGPARIYASDPEGRVAGADVPHRIRRAETHLRLPLEEELWEVRFSVVDAYTLDPIPSAHARADFYGRPVTSAEADPEGEIVLPVPAARLSVEVSDREGNYRSRGVGLLAATEPRQLEPVRLVPVVDPGPSAVAGRVFFRPTLQDPKSPWVGKIMVSKTYRMPDGSYHWKKMTEGRTRSDGRYEIDLPDSSGAHTLHFLRGDIYSWGEQGFATQRYERKEIEDYVIVPDFFDP